MKRTLIRIHKILGRQIESICKIIYTSEDLLLTCMNLDHHQKEKIHKNLKIIK